MDRRPDRLTTATHPDAATDADLLGRYVATHSPDAFAGLVDRYLPLIYSAALRQTRDPHLAEDAAQATLIILSQKAARIDPAMLPGWLVKTAHYAACNAVRHCARRHRHERRAAALRFESHTPADPDDSLTRAIDSALARLRDADRTAVVLRYFQNKSFADIAAHLKSTEPAVQRRVARAVEKLRAILTRQGIPAAPTALPAFLAAQSLHPIPPTLSAHAATLIGSKAAYTSLIAKGALHAMAVAKVKTAVAIAAALLLVGAAIPTAYHYATARMEAILPTPPSLAQSATPVPSPPADTDLSVPVTGSLPPGMTAEPIAILNNTDKRWLRPTGEELTNPPAIMPQLLAKLSRMSAPGATHALLFRISVPETSTDDWGYSISGSGNTRSTTTYDPATGVYYILTVFAPDRGANAITLTVPAANGPWTNNAVIPAATTTPVVGSLAGHPITFAPPTQDNKQVHIRCSSFQEDLQNLHDLCIEFYALDAAGKKVPNRGITGNMESGRFDFDGPLTSLKEFRLDTRPYTYHATYAPIPLFPAKR